MSSLLGPAFGLLELESLARGVVVADVLVKKAQVRLSVAEAVSPGKYLLLFSGEVAEVEESFKAGVEIGGAMVIDRLFLPRIDERVVAGLDGLFAIALPDDSLGIVETHTVAAAILAADTGLKRARVQLTQMHLAKGIGGKGWFTVAGPQADVEAALEEAAAAIDSTLLVTTELIARPHRELGPAISSRRS